MRAFSFIAATTAASIIGCVPEKAVAPALRDPAATLGSVTLSPPNAIVGVGGTVQLGMTAQSLAGTAIASLDSVLFQLDVPGDTLRIRVSTSGLVTGLASTGTTTGQTAVRINAFAYKNGVVKARHAFVQVTPTALSGLTLSIQPIASDSTRVAKNTYKAIVPVIRNSNTGQSVTSPSLCLSVKKQDASKAVGCEGEIRMPGTDNPPTQIGTTTLGADLNLFFAQGAEGTVWIHGEVNAYGETLRDSVLYTLTYPFTGQIGIGTNNLGLSINSRIGHSPTMVLAPGATVTFSNFIPATAGASTMTFTFAEPAAASAASPASTTGGATGNVSDLTRNQSSRRRFLAPGSYTWTATVGGNAPPITGQSMSGTIIIK